MTNLYPSKKAKGETGCPSDWIRCRCPKFLRNKWLAFKVLYLMLMVSERTISLSSTLSVPSQASPALRVTSRRQQRHRCLHDHHSKEHERFRRIISRCCFWMPLTPFSRGFSSRSVRLSLAGDEEAVILVTVGDVLLRDWSSHILEERPSNAPPCDEDRKSVV